MSLPNPNTPWPPLDYVDLIADTSIAQAWWEGDHGKLNTHYAPGPPNKSIQYAGGIAGKVGRMFWGNPSAAGAAPEKRLHIPVAADLCSTSARVLLPEAASFMLPTRDGIPVGNDQAQARLDLALNTPAHFGRMLSGAETASALGGVYPRVVWNADVADHAWLEYTDADQAIPEFTYGKLSAVTFWRVLEDNGTDVLRHFERYERGRIWHGLYLGTIGGIGRIEPLTSHHETRGIPVNEEGWIPTGTKLLGASYIPNALPNPKWRTKGKLRNLGRSDLTDPAVIGLMDAIDETYSSLQRDIRLAKARIVVSEHLLEVRGAGQGSQFVDREVYSPVGGVPTGDPVIQAHQFEIRVDEHLRSADAYLRQILMRVGYDASTFGLADDGAAMTATEVDSKDRRTSATHKAKAGLWQAGHAEVAQALIEVDAAVFRTGAQIGEPVEVSWPQSSRETTKSRAETVQLLETARAVSIETKVALMWPEWDEDRRQEEVDRIREEQSAAGDPFAVGSDMPVYGAGTAPAEDDEDQGADPEAEPTDDELPAAA